MIQDKGEEIFLSLFILFFCQFFVDDASSMQSSHNLKTCPSTKKTSSGSSNGTTPHSSSTATDPSSHHSHESGFQSAASLSSLDKNQNVGRGKCLGKYPSALQAFRTQESGKILDNFWIIGCWHRIV